jgi:spore coat polysaccharide biosynthesis protein SpsF
LKVAATIEARMSSSRLPGKVLMELYGAPMLARLVERVRRAKRVDEIIIATTMNPADDPVADLARSQGVAFFRGSEEDVLDRVFHAATTHGADLVVELTGDNPLIEPLLIDAMVAYYLENDFDYVANTAMRHSARWEKDPTFPVGTSVEVFSTELLGRVATWTQDPIDREHVSSFIFDRPEQFRLGAFEALGRFDACHRPDVRLTVDTEADLRFVREIYGRLYPANPAFTLMDVMNLLTKEPDLLSINGQVFQQRVFEQRQQQHV